MNKQNWSLDTLKNALNQDKRVKAWIITDEHAHRCERYFMSEKGLLALDQDRVIHSHSIYLKLFVFLEKKDRQGEVLKKLFPALPLKDQLEQAILSALQTDHQAWSLPSEVPNKIPSLATTDPRMAEDLERVTSQATTQIEKSIQKKRNSSFNSAELFLSVHNKTLLLSNGLEHRSAQSRIYVEAAYSFSKMGPDHKLHSDEYLSSHWAVSLDHLPIDRIFDHAGDCAEHSLDTVKPATGKYSVLVDADVLSQLLHEHLLQLSAANAYNGLPHMKPGDEFIPESRGDLLSISFDPTLDFGAATLAVSEQGLLQKPLALVAQNKVISTSTDKQYSDYLHLPITTVRGNVVVEAGNFDHHELTRQSPQVIEILQFSALFIDANSGTFSSEIRLAKLYDNETGKVSYLKGGSLSGSVSENFRGLRLSKNRVNRAHFSSESNYGQGYFGPEYALLSDVSIVG